MKYNDMTEKYSSNRRRRTTVDELKEKHGRRIGEEVNMTMNVATPDGTEDKKVRCKIVGMYENYVVLKTEFGYCRSMFWSDFEKALGKR